jgi:hypothetical protein
MTTDVTKLKIISGGQTGVDRGALDAAMAAGIACGGWCPKDRLAEDGAIDKRYPLQETASADYMVRTLKNVMDSDASLLIYFGKLEGGTLHTLEYCRQHAKPHLLINGEYVGSRAAAISIKDFVQKNAIQSLNVAGPRASKVKKAYGYALMIIAETLRMLYGKKAG